MEWIENLLGFSPDGGNGTLEVAITVLVLAVLCLIALAAVRNRGLRLPG